MAERRNIFERTQTTTSPIDPLRRRQVNTAFIEGGFTSDEAAAKRGRQRMPKSVTIDGTVVPLFSIVTTRVREGGAWVQALYQLERSGGVTQGFNRFRVAGGFEQVEWVRTPAEQGKALGKAFDKFGRPNGLINKRFEADGGGVPHSYQLAVPVWRITVETTLKFNPLEDLPIAGSINSSTVEWDEVRFPKHVVRFDAPVVDWITGDKSDLRKVSYTFTVRKDEHVHQVLTSATETQLVLTGRPVPFGGDVFPIARTGAL